MDFDQKYMSAAIQLAEKGMLSSFPNPSVGSLIVECDKKNKNDKIVGFGYTQKGGRPHAEVMAIKNVKFKKNKKYICYSTLEPCSHYGKSNPCVEKIAENPINEVVFAFIDPDKRVSGIGRNFLKEKGIRVRYGLLKQDLINFYAGYFLNRIKNRPKVILKMATSIDGKISYGNNSNKWITNSLSRKYVHMQRAKNEAILIGSSTAKIDNPKLTCRLNGLKEFSPLRIIINKNLDLSENLDIFNLSVSSTIIFTENTSKSRHSKFENKNVKILIIKKNKFLLKNILKEIAALGVSNLIVEGGAKINSLFLKYNLVDMLYVFRGNIFIGNKGLDLTSSIMNNIKFSENNFKLKKIFPLNDNHLEIYETRKYIDFISKVIEKY